MVGGGPKKTIMCYIIFGRCRSASEPTTAGRELWWYESESDVQLMTSQIVACEHDLEFADDITGYLGALYHYTELKACRSVTIAVKKMTQFAVDTYVSLAYYTGNKLPASPFNRSRQGAAPWTIL